MKSDMDRLMGDLNLDAVIVMGDESPNPYRDYLTGRAKATGTIFKKRGQPAAYVVNAMEIGEAQKSGLDVYSWYDLGWAEILQNYAGDRQAIDRELHLNCFEKFQISGNVAFCGVTEIAPTLALIMALRECLPNVNFVFGQDAERLFDQMYETKDATEIAHLRKAAELTSQVVRRTWDFISSHRAEGNTAGSRVVNSQGESLTIGAVKRFIRQQEMDLGLDDPEGCIFAQGRDGALPHSTGEDADVLQVGKSIVFDIFPRELNSGYFHDMTRTWCIGHAPAEVQAAYDDVMAIFRKVESAIKVGESSTDYQIMTMDYFESKEHPTHRTRPGTTDGYPHGLGHGLGLNVHEAPAFSIFSPGSILVPGNVFTIEPGLYYADLGFGVRIEDTVALDAEGKLQALTDFPYDLVLPLRGAF